MFASTETNPPHGVPNRSPCREIILHAFPTSVVDAMARNDVLQVVCFAVLFAMAVIAAGASGKPVLDFCSSLAAGCSSSLA
ncbi:MAG TPA: cation:dicarboxylase symporter family transporter [Lacunisphaera sp.]|jgi:Na+/H+-dicarboxylate symporter